MEEQEEVKEKKMSPVQMTLYGIGIIIVLTAIAFFIPVEKNKTNETTQNEVQQTEEVKQEKMEEPKDLIIEDLEVGTGKEATSGAKVTVNYTGTLTNGTKFDSSLDRNEPFTFFLGEGKVIEGWEKGLLGMKVGGKRKLTIPSSMAYGEQGAPPVIGPNETLIFEIELLSVE